MKIHILKKMWNTPISARKSSRNSPLGDTRIVYTTILAIESFLGSWYPSPFQNLILDPSHQKHSRNVTESSVSSIRGSIKGICKNLGRTEPPCRSQCATYRHTDSPLILMLIEGVGGRTIWFSCFTSEISVSVIYMNSHWTQVIECYVANVNETIYQNRKTQVFESDSPLIKFSADKSVCKVWCINPSSDLT